MEDDALVAEGARLVELESDKVNKAVQEIGSPDSRLLRSMEAVDKTYAVGTFGQIPGA